MRSHRNTQEQEITTWEKKGQSLIIFSKNKDFEKDARVQLLSDYENGYPAPEVLTFDLSIKDNELFCIYRSYAKYYAEKLSFATNEQDLMIIEEKKLHSSILSFFTQHKQELHFDICCDISYLYLIKSVEILNNRIVLNYTLFQNKNIDSKKAKIKNPYKKAEKALS